MPSIAFLALAAVPLLSKYAYADCAPVPDIKLTAYGFADGNSATTSFGCSGSNPVASGSAGGSGSYDDPFTLATAAGSSLLKECELIYVPYYKKYYRFQDHCSGCDSSHIDLWMGTDQNGGPAQILCEEDIGSSVQTIIKDPPSGLEVDGQNFWDGTCHTDAVFPNPNTNVCSGGGSGSQGSGSQSSPSSAAAAAPPAVTPTSAPVQQQPATQAAPAAQQPSSSSSSSSSVAAPAFTPESSHQKPQDKADIKQNVAPTTLKTVASTPITSNEPTGTPFVAKNGVCKTAGAAVCSADGKQIGICNIDMTVVFMDVAPGTKCVDGGMVFANS